MDSKVLTEDIIPNLKAKVDAKQTVVPIMANLGEIYTGTTPLSTPLDYAQVLSAVQANAQIVLVDNGASTTVGTPEYIEITRAYVGKLSTVVLEFSISNGFADGSSTGLCGVTYSLIVSSSSTVVNRIESATTNLSNVPSGSVAHPLLATNAVQADNINWSTIGGGVWSVFSNTDPTTRDFSVNTLKGTPLTLHVDNLGTTFRIDEGGENIKLIRNYWCCRYTGITTGSFGVNNLTVGSNIYTSIYGKSDDGIYSSCGSAVGATDSGQSHGELAGQVLGDKSGAMSECVMMRCGEINKWLIHGKIIASGSTIVSSSLVSYSTEVTAVNNECTPAIYQRDAPESAQSVLNVLEVFEEN